MSQVAATGSCLQSRSFVLQSAVAPVVDDDLLDCSPSLAPVPRTLVMAEIPAGSRPTHLHVAHGQLHATDNPAAAAISVRAVPRGFNQSLAVVAHRAGVLVNGVPALSFSLLDVRATLALPGLDSLLYLAERVRPHVGPPPAELCGVECPTCRIAFDANTRVGTCGCGLAFHYETAESHPHVAEADRLDCFQKTGGCPRCKAELSEQDRLVWSADEL